MNHSIKVGVSFGLTSGIITTLGLMVGLSASTNSKLAVIGGILTIAIADAFSDALGIHVSEESENKHTHREVWVSTVATFLSKFIFAMLFIIPVMLFSLTTAVIVSIVVGFLLLSVFSYMISKEEGVKSCKVIFEHLTIASIVIILTHYIGKYISILFGI